MTYFGMLFQRLNHVLYLYFIEFNIFMCVFCFSHNCLPQLHINLFQTSHIVRKKYHNTLHTVYILYLHCTLVQSHLIMSTVQFKYVPTKYTKVSYLLPFLLDKFVFKIAVCMQLCMVCLDLMSAE